MKVIKNLEKEKELWEEYDKICLNKIEEKKKRNYNTENLFKQNIKHNISNNLPVRIENKSIWTRLLERVKFFLVSKSLSV